MEWPIYFKDRIIVGNPDSEVGIVTLWTKIDNVLPYVDPKNYAAMCQLYSTDEGLSAIARNLAANPKLRHLIVIGTQLATRSGDALVNFFQKGLDSDYQVIGIEGARVEKEIPPEAIAAVRKHVRLHDLRGQGFEKLNSYLASLPRLGSYGKPQLFSKTTIKPPESFPSDDSCYIIRERYIADAWIRILDAIMRFGVVKKSQYGDDQREIQNLIVVISEEDPDNIMKRPFLHHITPDSINRYFPEITENVPLEGAAYKYGQRLRSYFGIDQVKSVIDILKEANFSRRAVMSTWDVAQDHDAKEPPCIDFIQALVHKDKLHLTAVIRSNEMFEGWPLNAYGLRKLQKIIAEEIGIQMGSLTTKSVSAHLYEPRWTPTMKLLRDYPGALKDRISKLDPRGNLVIRVEDGQIKITHLSPTGERVDSIASITKAEIVEWLLTQGKISQVSHALDIGAELEKAEIALRKGLTYEQDKPLDI